MKKPPDSHSSSQNPQSLNHLISTEIPTFYITRAHDARLDDLDVKDGTIYRGIADKDPSLTVPGLIVYRFDALSLLPTWPFLPNDWKSCQRR